ncbi:hypothetical protein EC988_001184 [Linderina pennispora]|nr:hypothetical protein EC988_001184 [Linderina pennispora]
MEEFGKTIVTDCEHWHTSSVIYARYYEAIEEKQIMEAVRMAPATNFFNPFEYFACVFNDIKYAFDVEKCEMAAKRALMRRKNKESILFEIYFSSDDDPVEFHYAQEQSTSAQWTAAFFKDLKKPSICLKKTGGFVKRGMSMVMSKL